MPLKRAHALIALLAVSHYGIAVCQTGTQTMAEYVALESKSKESFGFLGDQVLKNPLENDAARITSDCPAKNLDPTAGIPPATIYGSESEMPFHGIEDFEIAVRHDASSMVENPTIRLSATVDTDAAFTVYETREIGVKFISVLDGMVANSGDTRCPARKGAEGQSRTKQGPLHVATPGVRNDKVPPPKGKVLSELTGNRERAAETTAPYRVFLIGLNIHDKVTDCNLCSDGATRPTFIISDNATFESYQINAKGEYRFLDQKNMDLGFEYINYKGVPYVWDRDLPVEAGYNGTQYFINSKFLYSVVDNQRFFRPTEWMPTINQDGKVMRLHVRMNNVCSNRMLQGKVNWS